MASTSTTPEETTETIVSFNQHHYPDGLNANFKTSDVGLLAEKYAGPNGQFESREHRDIARNVSKIMDSLGDLSNQQIADIGGGTGLFVKSFDTGVAPSGQVYVNEISEGFLLMLSDLVKREGFTRTQIIQGTDNEPKIPVEPGSLDLVFLCDVYHHIERPISYMKKLRALLKKGVGRLVVIDFYRDDDKIWSHEKGWVMQHVRADQQTFTNEILEAGFTLAQEVTIDTLTENYFLIFTNP